MVINLLQYYMLQNFFNIILAFDFTNFILLRE